MKQLATIPQSNFKFVSILIIIQIILTALSISPAHAQDHVFHYASVKCFNDATIRAKNKFFSISYDFSDTCGHYQTGTIGYTCIHGVPDIASIKTYIANKKGINKSRVFIKLVSQICESDFNDICKLRGLNDIAFYIQ